MGVYSYIDTHVSYIHVYAIVRLFVGFAQAGKWKRRWIMKAHTCPCHLISHFFQFTICKLASCIHVNCQ